MKVFNLIVIRNGEKYAVNKNPMTEIEADEMYRDYKKSGIIFESLEIVELINNENT